MNTYHKINTIFKREQFNGGKLIIGEYSSPEFKYLKDNLWLGTEKVDGTNIRIVYDGLNKTVEFRGKTDSAQLPPMLAERLKKLFPIDKLYREFKETSVCLYGEGYGSKIQGCGSRYIKETNDFILFDIKIGSFWLQKPDIEEIASRLSVDMVELVFEGTLEQAIEFVKKGPTSRISEDKTLIMEGLILIPEVEMFNRKGDRIITKIKYKDFNK